MSRVQGAASYQSAPRVGAPARPGPARGGDSTMRRPPVSDLEARLALDPPGGLPYRMAMLALQNPVKSGGVLVSALAALMIVSNAVGSQPRRHPAPLFETRPFATAPAPGPRTPDRSQAGDAPVRPATPPPPRPAASAEPPVRTAAAPEPAPAAPQTAASGANPAATAKPKPRTEPSTLVHDVQVVLKDRGLYTGPLDGIAGPATADSIRVLERQLGLQPTGEPSERLIAAVQPRSQAPIPVRTTTVMPPPAPLGRYSGPEPLAAGGDERLQKVQRALLATGFGPVRTDGKMDERTQDAIRRYELDRGWPVTGKLSDRLVLDTMMAANTR
ncbi:peptidoglycan-binding domain-containing protein [Prosthecomicrobium sp. N25]|uniref:peptidoglycan-binding domain-containing protein n=1 Tax=Prosthecomicrobium sp. N25 TaxID=3129254 RepID=UPI0030772651